MPGSERANLAGMRQYNAGGQLVWQRPPEPARTPGAGDPAPAVAETPPVADDSDPRPRPIDRTEGRLARAEQARAYLSRLMDRGEAIESPAGELYTYAPRSRRDSFRRAEAYRALVQGWPSNLHGPRIPSDGIPERADRGGSLEAWRQRALADMGAGWRNNLAGGKGEP